MKAIILAAGKGTRLEPITLETPKAMVQVHGKSLLEHNMDKLLPYVDEFIIVVKYKKEVITSHFGNEFRGIPVQYHEQGDKKGTGAAIQGIKVTGDIVIAYADAIFSQRDIDSVMQEKDYSVLVKKVDNPEKYGIFKIDSSGYAIEVIEKPTEYVGNLANFSFLKVNDSILQHVYQISESPRGEIELTDAINIFIKEHSIKPVILEDSFLDITSVADLEAANKLTKPELGETQFLESIGEYEVHLGIPQAGIKEIVDYSLDETDTALREGTSDWKKRFISIENLSSWHEDTDRFVFTLLSKDGVVAGLWWGRPAKSPTITQVINKDIYNTLMENSDCTHTGAIRIYPFARGDRLASPFMSACSRYYKSIFDNIHMCVDIDEQNIPSQKAFEKIGYEKVGYGKNVNNSPESGKQRFVYLKRY